MYFSLVMSYSTHGWLSDRQWAGFVYLIRFKDRWEWNEWGSETVCLSFRINIHVKRSEVVHSFISIHTLMRCVRLFSSAHTHTDTHWYSSRNILFHFLLIHLPSIRWWWPLNEKNKSMALMTDTHKCRQESIEWSMSHPKRSLTAQRGEREDWLSS